MIFSGMWFQAGGYKIRVVGGAGGVEANGFVEKLSRELRINLNCIGLTFLPPCLGRCKVALVTKLECPGSSRGWNEWFCGKVAENCDSTGWLGIARPALLLSHLAAISSAWEHHDEDNDEDDDEADEEDNDEADEDAQCCIRRMEMSYGQWVSATTVQHWSYNSWPYLRNTVDHVWEIQ